MSESASLSSLPEVAAALIVAAALVAAAAAGAVLCAWRRRSRERRRLRDPSAELDLHVVVSASSVDLLAEDSPPPAAFSSNTAPPVISVAIVDAAPIEGLETGRRPSLEPPWSTAPLAAFAANSTSTNSSNSTGGGGSVAVYAVDRRSSLGGWEVDFRQLTLGREIGHGASGVVYKGTWRGTPCVVKQCRMAEARVQQAFLKEIEQMKRLRPHPNCTLLLGVCSTPTNPLCIVTEYVDGGSLWSLIKNDHVQIDVRMAASILKDVACGMVHIHEENILHADLASRNVLLAKRGVNDYVAKIADFGASHTMLEDATEYQATSDTQMPIRWTAPEVLLNPRHLSKRADVWSFGVVLYELLQRERPYADLPANVQVIHAVCNLRRRLPRPTRVPHPDELYELQRNCFATAPEHRPPFVDLHRSLIDVCAMLESGGEWRRASSALFAAHAEGGLASSNASDTAYTAMPVLATDFKSLSPSASVGDAETLLRSTSARSESSLDAAAQSETADVVAMLAIDEQTHVPMDVDAEHACLAGFEAANVANSSDSVDNRRMPVEQGDTDTDPSIRPLTKSVGSSGGSSGSLLPLAQPPGA